MKLTIATDFSNVTGLRHCAKSEKSGEEFYHTQLNPRFYEALQAKEDLDLELDGTLDSYAPSFLDEALGNLVYDFTLAVVKQRLHLHSSRNPSWIKMIEEETYPQWESRRKANEPRTVTAHHDDWYRRNSDGELEKGQWAGQN
ncbi:MAG: STAS-like domain-containing protein [Bacteroidales bacterium]|nr:STAS-like domain-containing protein [Bacteroidales bacterium]